jgi:putative transposase
MDDVREWQQRPLDDVYPVVFLDALVLKIREGGTVQRGACYLALGVTVEGERDVLGMWFQETEGAKFGMQSSASSSSAASTTSCSAALTG